MTADSAAFSLSLFEGRSPSLLSSSINVSCGHHCWRGPGLACPPSFFSAPAHSANSGDEAKALSPSLQRRLRWDPAFRGYVAALNASGGAGLVWTSPAAAGAAKLFGKAAPAPSVTSSGEASAPFDFAPFRGRLIVIGDLNVCATNGDIRRPAGRHVAGCTAEERAGLRALLVRAP